MVYFKQSFLDWQTKQILSLQSENFRIQQDVFTVGAQNDHLRGRITLLECEKTQLEKQHGSNMIDGQLLKEKIKKLEGEVSRLELDNKKLLKKTKDSSTHNRWVHKQWYKTKLELNEHLCHHADRYLSRR